MCGLMGVPLLLKEGSVVTGFSRFRTNTAHMSQIKRRRVLATREAHEVCCRQQDLAVNFSHGFLERLDKHNFLSLGF